MVDVSTRPGGPDWPNFLVIGAAKSGTTALYHQLKQHPDIFMSAVKEPGFFAHESDTLAYLGPGDESVRSRIATTAEEYLRHFTDAGDQHAIGEASVVYLYHSDCADAIKRHIPDVRLIAILRNPVERAFSNYLDNVRHGFEQESFAGALAAESQRAESGWSWYWRYRDLGFYGRQLSRFYDQFDREQIKVYLYEDYEADPLRILRDVFRFLEVDEEFEPDVSARYNVSGIPRSPIVDRLVKLPNPIKWIVTHLTTRRLRHRLAHSVSFQRLTKKRPEIPREIARDLALIYKDDIKLLEELTGRSLNDWTG